MIETDLLWRELDRATPNLGKLEVSQQTLVDLQAEVSDSAALSGQNDRSIIIWDLTLTLVCNLPLV